MSADPAPGGVLWVVEGDVMESIHINPAEGEHAAAAVPDEVLQSLLRSTLFEVAVRTNRHTFEEILRRAVKDRAAIEDALNRVRYQRDLMRFAEAVTQDLAALPVTAETGDFLRRG